MPGNSQRWIALQPEVAKSTQVCANGHPSDAVKLWDLLD